MAQVVYQFRAIGADAVRASFKSIGDAAEASARKTQRAIAQQAKGSSAGGPANKAADRQLASIRKEAATWEREEKAKTRATEREANARANAETKAATRAQQHVAKIRERYMAQQQRDGERAERAAEKAASKRAAAEQRAQAKASKQRWGGLGDDARSLGKGLALSAGAAVVGTLGVAARDSMALQEKANRISINARGSGEAFQDPTAMRKQFEATALTTPGIKAIDVADAVQKYVSLTGDTKTALSSQSTWATVASASGADIGDISEAAASLSKQFDITSIEEMREALQALTAQGKAGAFEIKDAAGEFQELAAAGAAFGLNKGAAGARKLGGLAQIARSGTGSASEASTAVRAVFAAFTGKQAELKKSGVSVFKDGKRRDIEDLLTETISKVGGTDIAKKSAGLDRIFGDRGFKAISPLMNTYQTAFQGATGTDKERQKIATDALRAAIQKATNATMTWPDMLQDAAQAQTDSSAQLTQAWERVTAMAGEELAPGITKLISSLSNSGAIDAAISGLGVFAAALGEVAAFMSESGLIPKKEKTLADKQAEAEKKLSEFDSTHGDADAKRSALDLLPEGADRDAKVAEADAVLAQRQKLADNVIAAKEAQWQPAGAQQKTFSVDEFSKKYRELGDGGALSDQRANDLEGLYRTGGRANEFAMPFENNDQRNYRRQFEGQLTFEQMQGGGGGAVDNSEAVGSMKEMAEAARAAATAMKNVKPAPSILGPGGP